VATNPNHLLVEDTDTKGAVIGLMRHHICWPKDESGWPAKIECAGSRSKVLSRTELGVKFKESDLVALGLIVDADTNFSRTWESVKNILRGLGGIPPDDCPVEGLVLDIKSKRLGTWIMPDNHSDGMVENFCHALIPAAANPSWNFARSCVDDARNHGATYKSVHVDKARMHTWLAWHDPPGQRMGNAITSSVLRHETTDALLFVDWFKKMFMA
jgi:hypothetical protein